MAVVLGLAGVLLVVYGGSALAGQQVAAHDRMRRKSRVYAAAALAAGIVLIGISVATLAAR